MLALAIICTVIMGNRYGKAFEESDCVLELLVRLVNITLVITTIWLLYAKLPA